MCSQATWGARWPGGTAPNSEYRGPGLDPQSVRRVVSLSNTHQLPQVLVNAQEDVAPSRHD